MQDVGDLKTEELNFGWSSRFVVVNVVVISVESGERIEVLPKKGETGG
jgi:hypothetical protein